MIGDRVPPVRGSGVNGEVRELHGAREEQVRRRQRRVRLDRERARAAVRDFARADEAGHVDDEIVAERHARRARRSRPMRERARDEIVAGRRAGVRDRDGDRVERERRRAVVERHVDHRRDGVASRCTHAASSERQPRPHRGVQPHAASPPNVAEPLPPAITAVSGTRIARGDDRRAGRPRPPRLVPVLRSRLGREQLVDRTGERREIAARP